MENEKFKNEDAVKQAVEEAKRQAEAAAEEAAEEARQLKKLQRRKEDRHTGYLEEPEEDAESCRRRTAREEGSCSVREKKDKKTRKISDKRSSPTG